MGHTEQKILGIVWQFRLQVLTILLDLESEVRSPQAHNFFL